MPYLARQGGKDKAAGGGQLTGTRRSGRVGERLEVFHLAVRHKGQRGETVLFIQLFAVFMPAGIQRRGVGMRTYRLMLAMVHERAERQRPVAQEAAAQHRQEQQQQQAFHVSA